MWLFKKEPTQITININGMIDPEKWQEILETSIIPAMEKYSKKGGQVNIETAPEDIDPET